MNNYTVYIHKNKINNKVYIGQTCQKLSKRWKCGRGYETSPRFYNAILKYGWNNFEHIIVAEHLSQDEANKKEKELIKQYNSTDDNYGYNITDGGNNFNHSEETKNKIGLANSVSLLGNKWTDHQRQIISEKFSGEGNPFYGKQHTDQTKQLISEHRKGKCLGEEHHMYGKTHTIETLNKISQNRTGKGGKKIKCVNTGEVFNTMMDAARWCGLTNSSSIGQVCNKTGKQVTAGKHPETNEKLYWEFVDE